MTIVYQSNYKHFYFARQRWYPYLVGKNKFTEQNKQYYRTGLLDNISLTPDHLIVCYTPGKVYDTGVKKVIQENGVVTSIVPYKGTRDFLDKSNNALRLYAVFPSSMQFYQYYYLLEPKHCYEIIRGDMPQKVHFDLDIARDKMPSNYNDLSLFANIILYGLLVAITAVLDKHNITLHWEQDVLIYQSHGTDKYSFHVLLKYYCHQNHQEAAKFYDAVIQQGNNSLNTYVDRAVYSKMQAFRLLKSSKYNTNRIKQKVTSIELDKLYEFENSDSNIEKFQHSLVSYVAQCQYLPSFNEKKSCEQCNILLQEKIALENNQLLKWTLQQQGVRCEKCNTEYENKKQLLIAQQVSTETSIKLLNTLESVIGQRGAFKIRTISNNYIVLDKLKPYLCPICKRQHNGENPYLTVQQDNTYYHCRRAGAQVKFLLSNNSFLDNTIQSNSSTTDLVLSTNNSLSDNTVQNNLIFKPEYTTNVVSSDNSVQSNFSSNNNVQSNLNIFPSTNCMPMVHHNQISVIKFSKHRKFDLNDY